MSGIPPIRILTVDDHPLLREGIAAVIEGQPDMTLVAEATNGREAIESFRNHRPDVVLMDLRMPDMNGIEAIRAIRTEFPAARIVVLTTYAGDVQALGALKAGASGYLLRACCGKICWTPFARSTPASGVFRRRSPRRLRSMPRTMPSPSAKSMYCAEWARAIPTSRLRPSWPSPRVRSRRT